MSLRPLSLFSPLLPGLLDTPREDKALFFFTFAVHRGQAGEAKVAWQVICRQVGSPPLSEHQSIGSQAVT